jgi:hypothetical protein
VPTFALIAARQICPSLSSPKSFQAGGEPNATWKRALNAALYPVTTRHWYWEVIKDGHEVVARGVADTELAPQREACTLAQHDPRGCEHGSDGDDGEEGPCPAHC